MNLTLALHKFVTCARRDGLGQALHQVRLRLTDHRTIPLWRVNVLGPNAAHGHGHQETDRAWFETAVDFIPRSCTFVDYGCGKGAALRLAQQAGFARVIGIEFVPQWAAEAREIAGVEVVTGDAVEYTPPAGPLVAYFYNPFDAHLMRQVAARLESHQGQLYVVYLNPQHPECFAWLNQVTIPHINGKVFYREGEQLSSLSPLRYELRCNF